MYYDKILNSLVKIGLTGNEAKIYIVLLNSGMGSISDISKRSGIYRTLVYQVVDKLIERGLIAEKIVGKKRLFEAAPPERLKTIVFERERTIKKHTDEVVKFLKNIHIKTEKPGIKTYFGIEGLKSALHEELQTTKEGGTCFVFHAIPEIPKILPAFISDYHKKRVERRIQVRAVYDSRQESIRRAKKLAEMKYAEVRIIPENYKSLISYHIYENNVLIISSVESDVLSILIENQKIADGFKENFGSVWKKSKSIKLYT